MDEEWEEQHEEDTSSLDLVTMKSFSINSIIIIRLERSSKQAWCQITYKVDTL